MTGTTALANGGDGIDSLMFNATIGGTSAGAGNIISSNLGDGILFERDIEHENLIQGNSIGTDQTGTIPLGNGRDGVEVSNPSNTIGGGASAANTIAYNGGAGVDIATDPTFATPIDDSILSNSIFDNTGARHRPGRRWRHAKHPWRSTHRAQ